MSMKQAQGNAKKKINKHPIMETDLMPPFQRARSLKSNVSDLYSSGDT
jgi:hypothetical protein